jgi:radical SAM superfamily enzyme YgiQ (UPF0313 family)
LNILFINPNRHQDSQKPPLGLLALATVSKQAGHHVQIQDQNIPGGIETPELDLIGISAMTPSYPEALSLATAFQPLRPKTKLIIGGVHASIFPDEVLATGLFDAVVSGEGEGAITQILGDLSSYGMPQKRHYKQVPLESGIPLPDYSLLPNLSVYQPRPPHAIRIPWTTVSTSRGCPFACRFCSRAVFGSKFRAMSAMRVVCLLEKLVKDYGIRDVTFYDDEFTLDRQRTIDLCQQLIAKHLDLTWTCEARVDLVDSELLRSMKSAGCRLILAEWMPTPLSVTVIIPSHSSVRRSILTIIPKLG